MPAVRDSSFAATTVATGTTLVLPTPTTVLNDLLIAVIVADTGTATWTSAGWTHVTGSPSTNTCQLVVMWKLAIATEAASYTFTATAAESFTGAMIAIQDVNTTNPFGSPALALFNNSTAIAKVPMSQITTTVANSLVLYASANSAAGVPSFNEGPVYNLIAEDGLAESLGVGWGFQPSTGLTPSTVICSNVAPGAGRIMTLQIAPPAAGATVIPAYVSSDLSVYVDPINGTTAYNGNTAIAATADTNYGTTLGGITAADAGIAAATDVGINSFHSTARVTSISASQNLAGVDLVFATANRPNVTGKNVLVHLGPSTEGQLQRFSKVSSNRGIWFGMRSGAATNYKIWQVYGAELGSLRHQPVIINESALNTKATAGTLAPASILSCGFWVAGNGITTTIWDFAQLWVLDTTTVVGGNAATPVTIAEIVDVVAIGKERKSVVLQGEKQMLVLQPLQFGDAGGNPLYLNLDSTAIEFPPHYNQAQKLVTYNSVNNVAGLTYDAGATDTIKHTNSIVSSANDYHWRIDTSSSALASYDFSGLVLIGAGDVVFRPVTTFTDMTLSSATTITTNASSFSGCVFSASSEITAASSTFASCSFRSSAGVNGALSITGATQTALQTELNKLTSNSFTLNTTPLGALRIIYTGTAGAISLSMSSNTFSGNTKDIRWEAPAASNLTMNLTGTANPSTFIATNSNTVTFSNPKTFTVKNIITDSEVRIYSGTTELGGAETVSASPTGVTNVVVSADPDNAGKFQVVYSYNYSVDTPINVVVFNVAYQPIFQTSTLKSTDGELLATQIADRQYARGTTFTPT